MKTYSYARFSSGAQKGNDSVLRQTESFSVQSFIKEHKLKVEQQMIDSGISGFKGKNFSNENALGKFIECVNNGSIETPSILLIENCDRFSRDIIQNCMTKFGELCKAGVKIGIVSLNIIVGWDELSNPMVYQMITNEFVRARAESKRKSEFRNRKIETMINDLKAGKIIWLGANAPKWFKGFKDGAYQFNEDKKAVVQDIFARYLKGQSCHKIADELHKLGTPTLRTFKQKGNNNKKMWTNTTVGDLLRNKNVIGELNYGGVIVKKFYPPIISEKDFLLVQAKRKSSTKNFGGSKYGLVRNIFKGILICNECGQNIETHGDTYKTVKGVLKNYSRYVCRGVTNKTPCSNVGKVRTDSIEGGVFFMVLNQSPTEILFQPKTNAQSPIAKLELELLQVQSEINDTAQLIGKFKVAAIAEKLETLTKKETELKKSIEGEKAQDAFNNEAPLQISKLKNIMKVKNEAEVKDIIRSVINGLKDTPTREKLRNLMPSLFSAIKLDFTKKEFICTFTNGKQHTQSFEWLYEVPFIE